jgi:hypothetical protein
MRNCRLLNQSTYQNCSIFDLIHTQQEHTMKAAYETPKLVVTEDVATKTQSGHPVASEDSIGLHAAGTVGFGL